MELKQYWQILWKRRWWVLAAFLAVVMITGVVTFTMPPVYEASSKLLLEQKDKTLSAIGTDLSDMSDLSSISRNSSPLDTQAELLKSTPVVEQVIKRVDLRDKSGALIKPEDFLRQARVETIKGTDILQISFQNTDRFMATQVADTWADVFLEQNRLDNRLEASSAAQFISSQLDKTKDALSTAEQALRDYKQSHGAIDLDEEAKASVQSLTDLEAQLRQAEAAQEEAETRVNALRSQIGLSASDALASTALSQDPTIQELRKQLLQAETNPLLASDQLTSDHPEVKQLRAQIATLRRTLAREAASILGQRYAELGAKDNLDPVRQALTQSLVQAQIDELGYQTRVDSLRSLMEQFNGRLTNLPTKELNLTRLMRNASVTEELYKMLLQKREEARIQEAENVGNIRIVEEATMPDKPIKPKKLQNMLVAVVVGLTFGVGVAMFLEYLDDTIQTTEDAEQVASLPTLGTIPWLRASDAAQLVTLSDPRSPASEAYRTLRTNIKFLSADTPLRTLTITSAGPEEGKSTTIANLAVSFAQTGKRVLIVDTDLRKPTIHTIFGLSSEVGLTSVLAGDTPLLAAMQPTPQENLLVLTCGPLPPNPAELLESQRMSHLIEELKSQFDVVLFDAPPIIAVTDASLLASRLDGLILLLGVNKVSRKAARHSLQLLESAKVKVWGMVVRGIRPDSDGYYYSYYHRYYGKVEKDTKKRQRKREVTAAVPAEPAREDFVIDLNKVKKS